MAREYVVGCLSCGAVWRWYKYDPPDRKCPSCGASVSTYDKDLYGDGFGGGYEWDSSAATIFGVWTSDTDVSSFHRKTMKDQDVKSHNPECMICARAFHMLVEGKAGMSEEG